MWVLPSVIRPPDPAMPTRSVSLNCQFLTLPRSDFDKNLKVEVDAAAEIQKDSDGNDVYNVKNGTIVRLENTGYRAFRLEVVSGDCNSDDPVSYTHLTLPTICSV
eukprot:101438-Rhodomonas_salina.1